MNSIVNKAIELYNADCDLGCIGDESCECFACELRRFVRDNPSEIDAEIETKTSKANKEFRDYCERYLATQIGNKLRCGCWDGVKMDRLFNEHFTEQMQEEMIARLRGEVRKACVEYSQHFFTRMVDAASAVARRDELEERLGKQSGTC